MFTEVNAFSGFSVDDIPAAHEFYGEVLGLDVTEENGMLHLHLATGAEILVYPKSGHTPASFTILNFPVADVGSAADRLRTAGVEFLSYDGMGIEPDEHGVYRASVGPDIAWFTDPAGNVLSILQEK